MNQNLEKGRYEWATLAKQILRNLPRIDFFVKSTIVLMDLEEIGINAGNWVDSA